MERGPDREVVEAASWKLASDLVSRHPRQLRILRTFPGDGQYDCLTIVSLDYAGVQAIQLNRHGTIQVHGSLSDRPPRPWPATDWETYLTSDTQSFLEELEVSAGLDAPRSMPRTTKVSLTYRVLAAVAALGRATGAVTRAHSGLRELDGSPGVLSPMLDAFEIAPVLRERRATDLYGEPGTRFWVVTVGAVPALAFEQESGVAWVIDRAEMIDLRQLSRQHGRDPRAVARQLLLLLPGPLTRSIDLG